MNKKIVIGIDACRIKSGGGVNHVIQLLKNTNPESGNFKKIHLWSYKKLLDKLPEYDWLIKHSSDMLEKNLLCQLYWQYSKLKKSLTKSKCNILFTLDAASLCRFYPQVVLSQETLAYDYKVRKKYIFSKEIIRIFIILIVQNFSFKKAKGIIFLSEYALNLVSKKIGSIKSYCIIPHGIDEEFKIPIKKISKKINSIKIIYVSPTWRYKNHINVIHAIKNLKLKGYDIQFEMIGHKGEMENKIKKILNKYDADQKYIKRIGNLNKKNLIEKIDASEIYLFASSCENLPITLLEGMSRGKIIISSRKRPMTDVLGNEGIYFDPENLDEIESAIIYGIQNHLDNNTKKENLVSLSKQYNWKSTSQKTFQYINHIYNNN